MGLLNLLAAGAALKVEPSKTAEIRIRATEKVMWSAEARVELFSRFVIESLFWIRSVGFCRKPIRRTCAPFPGGHFRENRLPMSRFSSQISPHRAMAWDRAAPLARSGDANKLSSVARRYATRSPNVSVLPEATPALLARCRRAFSCTSGGKKRQFRRHRDSRLQQTRDARAKKEKA